MDQRSIKSGEAHFSTAELDGQAEKQVTDAPNHDAKRDMEKKLVRKLDMRLMPVLVVMIVLK